MSQKELRDGQLQLRKFGLQPLTPHSAPRHLASRVDDRAAVAVGDHTAKQSFLDGVDHRQSTGLDGKLWLAYGFA